MAQKQLNHTGKVSEISMATTNILNPQLGSDFTPTRHNDTYPAIDPTTESDCTGKHVFVTGASKGIGRATALAYAKAGAAAIGLAARSDLSSLENEISNAAEKAGKKAPKVLSCVMDVVDREAIEGAAKEVERSFGTLDILVNNAGYLETWVPIADSDPDEWWKTWTVVSHDPLPQPLNPSKNVITPGMSSSLCFNIEHPRHLPRYPCLRSPTPKRWRQNHC